RAPQRPPLVVTLRFGFEEIARLARVATGLAAGGDGGSEVAEDGDGRVPAYAGVGDALAVDQPRGVVQVLAPLDQKALHHHADDAGLALRDLGGDLADHEGLARVVLVAVAVTGVDHEARRQSGVAQRRQRLLDMDRVVIRPGRAAAQDDVAVGVAR